MPEYLAPGVYIVEVAQGARPIDGVSTSTARLVGLNTIKEIQRLTDPLLCGKSPDKDMAVALVELLAWLADSLARHLDDVESEAWLPTANLAAASLALATRVRRGPERGAIKRVSFFEGGLLEASDFNAEADYVRDRRQSKFSPGIVRGLDVVVADDDETIMVTPGYAIDGWGRGVALSNSVRLTASHCARHLHVILRPPRRCPSVALKALPEWFLAVEKPEHGDLVLETLERTSCGWRIAQSHAA